MITLTYCSYQAPACHVLYYTMLCIQCSYLIHYVQYYAHEKLVPYFAPSWHDYYITKVSDSFIKNDDHHANKSTNNDLFAETSIHLRPATSCILPMVLALCLMPSVTYYAQNYIGIIGLAYL